MFKRYATIGIFILLTICFAAQLTADEYIIDKAHSSISFTVTHMTVSKVRGKFKDVSVTVNEDTKDITKSSVSVVIKAASVNTDNEGRDKHLRSKDFFDVEKYPEITFKSTGIKKKGEKYALVGTFTMHGVSKEIIIPFKITGKLKTKRGTKMGAEAYTIIDRKDYGVSWNKSLDQGGLALGNKINVEINLELNSKK